MAAERLIFGLGGPRASDRVEPGPAQADEDPPLVLDLSVDSAGGAKALRLLYDGAPGEEAAFGSLLSGRAPVIAVVDGTGQVLAHGRPSVETAESLTEAFESVLGRAATVIDMALAKRAPAAAPVAQGAAGACDWAAAARYAARTSAMTAVRYLYRLCTYSPHWRIGWRYVEGPGVLERGDFCGAPFRRIPDPGLRFYADPFPVSWRGQTSVFFEDFDHKTQKGVISAIPFDASGPTGGARIVLETPWHLSYPFMMEHKGELWMIPESSNDKTVRLYRSTRFPDGWTEEAVLLQNVEAGDATVTSFGGRLWMFAATRDGAGAPSDTLSIYVADEITGPWRPHAGNPILVDAALARPAGAMLARNGRLLRPIQDCTSGYGRAITIAEVTSLTEESFEQKVLSVLSPGPQWPGRRLHTLNRWGALECIDGSATSPRLLRPFAARRGKDMPGAASAASAASN
ncbi:hypothetical protein ABEG18_06565 [Alsobacter sp. KACC 23698]|uniref:Glucosamine inositolphosphorylceramide transferase 1 N-terminal domain-containing protein n=1 Tax=Alsobacter sp. KACC 23698 TaxID=3149229 RepID=A0AAU7JJC6_9HYPH